MSETNLYRLIFDNIHDAAAVFDDNGELINANNAFHDLFSFNENNKISLDIFKILNIDKIQKNLLLNGKILDIVSTLSSPDLNSEMAGMAAGSSAHYRIKIQNIESASAIKPVFLALFFHEKDSSGIFNSVNDIYQYIFEKVPAAIFIQFSGKFAYINEAALKLFGADRPEELLGTEILERVHPDFRQLITERINNINKIQRPNPIIDEIYLKMDGSSINVEISDFPFSDHKVKGAIVFINDITKQKRAEKDLISNADKMRSIFNTVHIGIGVMEGTVIKEVNNRICEITGYDSNEFIDRDIKFLLSNDNEYTRLCNNFFNSNITVQPVSLEISLRKKNGEIIFIAFRHKMISSERNSQAIFVVTDISERKHHQDQIQFLSGIADAAPTTFIVHDFNGKILYANEQFYKTYGYTRDEFNELHLHKLISHKGIEFVPLRRQKILEIGEASFEIDHVKKDGTIFPIKSNVRVTEWEGKKVFLSVCTDLTEQKLTGEYVGRAQKLESLGILAGGIAHDFNNLLGVLFGYLNLAIITSTEKEVVDYLEKAFTGFERAKSLTQQLLTFSKGGAPVRKVLSIASMIREFASFALSGSDIIVKYDIPEDLWLSEFDENQIGQLIDNILINSKQAMPFGGRINITAENVFLNVDEYPSLKEGNYVKIKIMDTGCGIPEDVLPKIFDPFFTTKKSGNGLGLATAYSIMKKHNGDIFVESKTGVGTTFYILLPASHNLASPELKLNKKEHKGSGKVLIMDDEPSIRNITGQILDSMGYETDTAHDGDEALKIFREALNNKKPFDMVFLDLTIPGGKGGEAIVDELRNLDSGLIAFAMSGYSDNPVMSDPVKYKFTDRLFKPFMKHDIAEMLNRYLSEGKL